MSPTRPDLSLALLNLLERQAALAEPALSPAALVKVLGVPRASLNRHLARLLAEGRIEKLGAGPMTRYRLRPLQVEQTQRAYPDTRADAGFRFSPANLPLIAALQAPLASRRPVAYQREWLDDYQPNHSSLLPAELAAELFRLGRSQGQQPAGTYARKVLDPLLIDLSWHSSRLEGNRKNLLDTRELFARGEADPGDADALMLLNHKEAIEFLVDTAPEYGLTEAVIRNLHALLMQGLLADSGALGQFRRTLVGITDSVFIPLQHPQLLEEGLQQIIAKAALIKQPIEAAFFLWLHLAYLQPFEDGNKRSSRLGANLPLLLYNCAPLSFLDVEPADYALAMLGFYEQHNPALAVELFAWTYRRSISKYAAILEALGTPDPFRQRYRERLGEALRRVVAQGQRPDAVLATLALPPEDQARFADLLRQELAQLQPYNCARYRLAIPLVEQWVAAGRPGRE